MQNEINRATNHLKKGNIILYPTDTVWGIGCDSSNYDAITTIYKLKKREDTKSLICLVSDIKMLQNHVEEIPQVAYDLLRYSNNPLTIVFDKPIRVSENLIANDNTLAIRVVKEGFAHELSKKIGRPLVSTSANISGEPTPISFTEISAEILKGVDYVVNLKNQKSSLKPSSIIKLSNDGKVSIIRE